MKQRPGRISLLNVRSGPPEGFQTAVSLHSHTNCSKEGLDLLPRYASRVPLISSFFDRERDRYFRSNGRTLDLGRGYWTPPVGVEAVVESETERIKQQLGLQPLISLTDHDDISTARWLRSLDPSLSMPISLEWKVPIKEGVLHLGVHNLPFEACSDIVTELALFTMEPKDYRFVELLTWLNEYPETLLVLNHPFSDLSSLGIERVKVLVMEFLDCHSERIHALEINGYRSWKENYTTVVLAGKYRMPVVSGGDRHGCAPNAVLNLTNVETFSEFVSEIRYDKVSEVLLMPEYGKQPLMRRLESIADFFRYYPDNPDGQKRWTDRVFFQVHDEVVRPLSYYWHRKVPTWVKSVIWAISLIQSRYLQLAVGKALAGKEEAGLHGPTWENLL